MSLEIKLFKRPNYDEIQIRGKLNTLTSHEFGTFLEEALSGGGSVLVLDLRMLDYISSSGLREILKAGKAITKRKGRLALYGANEIVHDVLAISGCTTMFSYAKKRSEIEQII